MGKDALSELEHRTRIFDLHRGLPEATISRPGVLSADDKALLVALRVKWNSLLAAAAGGGYITQADLDQHKAEQHVGAQDLSQLAGSLDHGGLAGLADDDHTQYARLVGRAGGQTLNGGNGSGDPITIRSSSHATKGDMTLQAQEVITTVLVQAGGYKVGAVAGIDATVALAKITPGGADGSATFTKGILTAYTPPT